MEEIGSWHVEATKTRFFCFCMRLLTYFTNKLGILGISSSQVAVASLLKWVTIIAKMGLEVNTLTVILEST